jgi:predicted O-methyltransferase YrrM
MTGTLTRVLQQHLRVARESHALRQVPSTPCGSHALRWLTAADLARIFNSSEILGEWQSKEPFLKRACPIQDGRTGGVNPGDRRAVWYLVYGLGARSVLEIGTHVGASTLHIAAALQTRRSSLAPPQLVTVDIQDVNSEVSGYWKQYGLAASPRDMIRSIDCGDFVRFAAQPSLEFLDQCTEKFDLIFLDGDHAATTVYQEIPRALNALNANGVLLLHDYFPNNRPLWPNGSFVPGPYVATARLQKEGVPIQVIPLGDLPWSTKEGSRTTSLAVVTRRH